MVQVKTTAPMTSADETERAIREQVERGILLNPGQPKGNVAEWLLLETEPELLADYSRLLFRRSAETHATGPIMPPSSSAALPA